MPLVEPVPEPACRETTYEHQRELDREDPVKLASSRPTDNKHVRLPEPFPGQEPGRNAGYEPDGMPGPDPSEPSPTQAA